MSGGFRRRGDERDILELLDECRGGLEITTICWDLDRSESWVKARLAELYRRGRVRKEKWNTGREGHPSNLWFLAET